MARIVYAGTPEFAVPALQALIDAGHPPVAVYTQPDRPAGRGRKLTASPVKRHAEAAGIPVHQPVTLKDDAARETLRALQPDLMVVAAYGLLLPPAVLELPRRGCVNLHASLLPRWRGAAPIQRAILAGDRETGITLMQMDEGLDTGGMLARARLPIGEQDTAAGLHDALAELGAALLIEHLPGLLAGRLHPQPQNDAEATHAAKLSKDEAAIDWRKPARLLQREVRAFNPWPVSHTRLDGRPVKIWSARLLDEPADGPPGQVLSHDAQGIRVATGEGQLLVDALQFAGKQRRSAAEVLNARNLTGERFGDGAD
jgi:methionyl-tRNA formyltransferase